MAENLSEGPSSKTVIARRVSRVVVFTCTVVLVLVFGINRPELIHKYYTADISDNVRHGLKYTCGCSSQPVGVTPTGNPDPNRCYDRSTEVGDKDVIRFPQFNGDTKVFEILQDTYPNYIADNLWRQRPVEGLRVFQQGRYISSTNDSFLENFNYLFLNDPQERRRSVSIAFLESGGFPALPTSYVAISFTFNCTNCTLCPISSVLDILNGLGTPDQPWGDCHYWGRKNHCGNGSNQQFYEAKCVVYSRAAIPLNFALVQFLRKLQDMPGINDLNEVIFNTNEVYMDFDTLVEDNTLKLNFFQVPRTSSAFARLVELYPGFARQCDSLSDVTVCNGTSVCNLFKISQEDGYAVRCSEMKNRSECQRDIDTNDPSYINVTVDDAENFGSELGDFSALICMNRSCPRRPSHELFWHTAPHEKDDSLNFILQSEVLSNFWNQQLSLCTTTYKQVTRERFNNMPVYLETECSRGLKIINPSGICRVTGRLNEIVDLPGEAKGDFPLDDSLIFECIGVSRQAFFVWLIVSFGIIFGWLGTVEMLFSWILYPLALQLIGRLKRRGGKKTDETPSDREAQIVDVDSNGKGLVNGNPPTENLSQPSRSMKSTRSISICFEWEDSRRQTGITINVDQQGHT